MRGGRVIKCVFRALDKMIEEEFAMSYQDFLLQFAKGYVKKSKGIHYTLTPNHLYIHNKKKLHKSKSVWRFSMDESGLVSCFSDNGGETWSLALGNDFILLNLSDVLKVEE